ncbi:MAG: hypothetical protein AB7P14_28040 [Blastocatellales bacterium]
MKFLSSPALQRVNPFAKSEAKPAPALITMKTKTKYGELTCLMTYAIRSEVWTCQIISIIGSGSKAIYDNSRPIAFAKTISDQDFGLRHY